MIAIFTDPSKAELISWVTAAGERIGIPPSEFKVIPLDKEGIHAREHGRQIRDMAACIVDVDIREPFYYSIEMGSLGEAAEYVISRVADDERATSSLDSRLLLVTQERVDSHRFLRELGEYYSSMSLAGGINDKLTEDLASWLKETLDRSQPKLFISYRSESKEYARSLAEILKGRGASIWFDEWNIMPGDSIPEAINRGLGWCTHLILVVDESFFESRWATAEYETILYRDLSGRAIYFRRASNNRPLIPLFMVDPASTKMPPILARIRGIDCRNTSIEVVVDQLWNAVVTVGPR